MKKIIFPLIGLMLLVSLVGCAPARAPAPTLPTAIVFASLKEGTSTYGQSVAMADVLQRHTGMTVSVSPAPGVAGMIDVVHRGEAIMSVISGMHLRPSWLGGKGYEELTPHYVEMGPFPLRVLVVGDILPMAIIVHGKAGVNSIPDLRGKKIFADSPSSPANIMILTAYLAAHNMKPYEDVEVVKMASSRDAMKRVVEGAADGVCCSAGGSKMIEFNETCGGFALSSPIDAATMKIYQKHFPSALPVLEKEGQPGVPAGTTTFGQAQTLSTTKECSDELAYTVTKTVLENLEELVQLNAVFLQWSLERAVIEQVVPYHPGAIKYYKEKGVWTSEMANRQKELLKEGP